MPCRQRLRSKPSRLPTSRAKSEVGGVQDRQISLDVFVGRVAELSRVAEVVARVAAGQPWLVAIEGDPGMGKTTLARRCLTQADGLRVLSARADQAEAGLDFGLADQLFRATGSDSPVLSTGGGGPVPSSFAVGARLLEVLGGRQATGPVAIALPLRGVSAIDSEGKPFYDPQADRELFHAIRANVRPNVKLL